MQYFVPTADLLRHGSAAARLLVLRVRIPPLVCICPSLLSVVRCTDGGLYDGPITCSEEMSVGV